MNTMQNDEPITFLLPRPTWVNDLDVAYCSSCNNSFGPLRRKHHCRNCGNIFCHDCSSRRVPLPQLGYGTKPVRVCNGCFDVAYLVTYAIDEDHGISTQVHGVRGLLELTEKDEEKNLHNMVAYGGVDALIWLCRSSRNIKLHHLTTTILAMLAEKESIRPVIITKWALPSLLYLVRYYTIFNTTSTTATTSRSVIKKSPANSIHSSSTTSPSLSSNQSDITTTSSSTESSQQSIILEIIINCTHILYQLSRAGILSQKEVVSEGVLNILLLLAAFQITDLRYEQQPLLQQDNKEEQQQVKERILIVQSLAAKAISAISSLVSFQTSIIELIQGTNTLSSLLRSSNEDVKKYMAKAVAYLSLRNDKYKPSLLMGDGSKALVFILVVLHQVSDTKDSKERKADLSYYLSKDNVDEYLKENNSEDQQEEEVQDGLNAAAVSHACCALANFATNNESQINLMSQPRLLKYICNVPLVFPTHAEIHRHVARCLANLALYAENNKAMLGCTEKSSSNVSRKDAFNVLPTLLFMGQMGTSDAQRHIVRAIDNLSSNVPMATETKNGVLPNWKELFGGAYFYISKVLENDHEKDVDMIKRAKSIIAREKLESKKEDGEDLPTVNTITIENKKKHHQKQKEITIIEEKNDDHVNIMEKDVEEKNVNGQVDSRPEESSIDNVEPPSFADPMEKEDTVAFVEKENQVETALEEEEGAITIADETEEKNEPVAVEETADASTPATTTSSSTEEEEEEGEMSHVEAIEGEDEEAKKRAQQSQHQQQSKRNRKSKRKNK